MDPPLILVYNQAINNNLEGVGQSSFDFNASAGAQYYIVVGNVDGVLNAAANDSFPNAGYLLQVQRGSAALVGSTLYVNGNHGNL
jgi:hypothetical protein